LRSLRKKERLTVELKRAEGNLAEAAFTHDGTVSEMVQLELEVNELKDYVLIVHSESFWQVVPQAVLLYSVPEDNEMDENKDSITTSWCLSKISPLLPFMRLLQFWMTTQVRTKVVNLPRIQLVVLQIEQVVLDCIIEYDTNVIQKLKEQGRRISHRCFIYWFTQPLGLGLVPCNLLQGFPLIQLKFTYQIT